MRPVIEVEECDECCGDGCYVLGCWYTRTGPLPAETKDKT